ncbi:MAG TPA: ABC transporter permease [Candidatus Acidoferrum sp.]|nr:ABC transporter permease [Candidatus Acidoferrum sp.]
MHSLWQDFRFGFRNLLRNPGFTAIAALTLSLGIGANTAIFSVADAFLLRPLPFSNLDRLAAVVNGQKAPVTAADYLDWKAENHSFEQLAAYKQEDVSISGDGQPEQVFGVQVTADFLETLAQGPQIGRGFAAGEDEPGKNQVAILSYGLWQSRFGGDSRIAGRTVNLDGKPFTVIGVMGRDFNFPVPTDLWTPFDFSPQQWGDRKAHSLKVVGRLKVGVSIAQAQAEMKTISGRLELAYPATNKNIKAHVMPLAEFVEGTLTRSATFLLLAVVGVVLLIACANIANLQLSRGSARGREIAVRAALGASRLRVVRLLLAENVLLALFGGAASLLFSDFFLRLLLHSMPGEIARLIPGWDQLQLDNRSLLFTMAIAILSGILAGLWPAFGGSKADLNLALREGGRGSTGSRLQQRFRSIFVVAQIATALALLVSANLAVRGLRGILHSADAYDPGHTLVLAVNLPAASYSNESARARFYQQATDRLASLPGVQSAAMFSAFPLSNNGVDWEDFQIEGRVAPDAAHSPNAVMQSVSPGYFGLMHVQLKQGRNFTDGDTSNSLGVAIVSEKLARRSWPGQSAIGKRIQVGEPDSREPWLEVVGVAGDVLYDWTNESPEAVIYRPVAQSPMREAFFGLRVAGAPSSFSDAARAHLATLDPLLPAFDVMSLDEAIHESLAGNSQIAGMMGILSFIALVIAIVGVYGVVAFAVTARLHEFGIRMALGAQKRDIFLLVMRRGALLAAGGLAVGGPAAFAMGKVLSGGLFGIGGVPTSILVAVAAVLIAVTLVACWIPARRATRVDPLVALRYE